MTLRNDPEDVARTTPAGTRRDDHLWDEDPRDDRYWEGYKLNAEARHERERERRAQWEYENQGWRRGQ